MTPKKEKDGTKEDGRRAKREEKASAEAKDQQQAASNVADRIMQVHARTRTHTEADQQERTH